MYFSSERRLATQVPAWSMNQAPYSFQFENSAGFEVKDDPAQTCGKVHGGGVVWVEGREAAGQGT